MHIHEHQYEDRSKGQVGRNRCKETDVYLIAISERNNKQNRVHNYGCI